MLLVLSCISCDLFASNVKSSVIAKSKSSGQLSTGPKAEVSGFSKIKEVAAPEKVVAPRRSLFPFTRRSTEGINPQNPIAPEVSRTFWSSFKDYFKKSESDVFATKESRFDSAIDRAAAMTSKTYESVKGAPGAAARQIKALANLLKRLTSRQKDQLSNQLNEAKGADPINELIHKFENMKSENVKLRNEITALREKQSGLQLTEPQVAKIQDKSVEGVKPENVTSQSKLSPERIKLNEVLQDLENKLIELQDGFAKAENPRQAKADIVMTKKNIDKVYKNIIDVMTSNELQAQLTVELGRKNELQPRVERFNALTVEDVQLNKAINVTRKKINEAKKSGDQSLVDQFTIELNQYTVRQKEIRNELPILEIAKDSLTLIDQRITLVQEKLGVQSEGLVSNGLFSQIGVGAKLNTVTVETGQKNVEPDSLKSNNNPITLEAIKILTGDVLAPAALAKLQLSKIGLFEARGEKILNDIFVSKEVKDIVKQNMQLLQGRRTELQLEQAEQSNAVGSKRFEGREASGAPMLKGAAPQEQAAQTEVVSYVFKNPIEQIAAQRKFVVAAENVVQVEVSAKILAKKAEIEAIAVAKFDAVRPQLESQIRNNLKKSLEGQFVESDHVNFDRLVNKRLEAQKDVMIRQELKNQDGVIAAMEKAGQVLVDRAGQEAVARFQLEVDAARKNEPIKTGEKKSNKVKRMTLEEFRAEQAQIAQIKKNVETDFKANKESVWRDAYEIKPENIHATSKDMQVAVDAHVAKLQKDAVAKWREEGKPPVQLEVAVPKVKQQALLAPKISASEAIVDVSNKVVDSAAIGKINNDLIAKNPDLKIDLLDKNVIIDSPEVVDAKEVLLKDYRSRDRSSMKSKDIKRLDSAIAVLENNIASVLKTSQVIASPEPAVVGDVVSVSNQNVKTFDPAVIKKINHDLGKPKDDLGKPKSDAIVDGPELLDAKKQLLEKYRSRPNEKMKAGERKTLDSAITALENDILSLSGGVASIGVKDGVAQNVAQVPIQDAASVLNTGFGVTLRSTKDRVQPVEKSSGSVADDGSAPVVSRLRKVDRSVQKNGVDRLESGKSPFGNIVLRSAQDKAQVVDQASGQVVDAGSTSASGQVFGVKLRSRAQAGDQLVGQNAVSVPAQDTGFGIKLRSRPQTVDQASGQVAVDGSAPAVSRLRKVNRSAQKNGVDGMVSNKPEFASIQLRSSSNNVTQNMNQASDIVVGN